MRVLLGPSRSLGIVSELGRVPKFYARQAQHHQRACQDRVAVTADSEIRAPINLAEEINQEFGDAGWLLVLEPVRSIGESDELGLRAIAKAVLCHFGH
jgi:hypothetical protein